MKCEEIEQWLYLFKPGERTEKEDELVREHISTCVACTKLSEELKRQGIQAEDKEISLNTSRIHERYKEQILEKVMQYRKGASANNGNRSIQSYLQYFTLPAYRYACASIISLLVLGFLLQNYYTYRNISQLETRFGNPSTYIAASENNSIVIGKDDFRFIKSTNEMKAEGRINARGFKWIKDKQLFFLSMRRHRLIREIADHYQGINVLDIFKTYKNSVYIVESKRNSIKSEERL